MTSPSPSTHCLFISVLPPQYTLYYYHRVSIFGIEWMLRLCDRSWPISFRDKPSVAYSRDGCTNRLLIHFPSHLLKFGMAVSPGERVTRATFSPDQDTNTRLHTNIKGFLATTQDHGYRRYVKSPSSTDYVHLFHQSDVYSFILYI
jgi:hypothetical protein